MMVYIVLSLAEVNVLPVRPPVRIDPCKCYPVLLVACCAAYYLWERHIMNSTILWVPLPEDCRACVSSAEPLTGTYARLRFVSLVR